MTGSGMGCPDWPKCFGYYIPPTEAEALEWKPNQSYDKGQLIIRNEQLVEAKKTFTTSSSFEASNWEAYTKHDYAVFNPWHTWIEYINRLLGALAGLFTLALFLSTLRLRPFNTKLMVLALIILLGILFQAWLGATVVYSVLNPLKISLHMLMALVLVALLFYMKFSASTYTVSADSLKPNRIYIGLALGMTLIQILLGTQVRQSVDHFLDEGMSIEGWINKAPIIFYIHRSFSIAVLLINVLIFWRLRKQASRFTPHYLLVLGLLFLEVSTGVAMNYFAFPFSTQPLHLVIASLLFGLQAYLFMRSTSSPLPSKI
jgi:cytochrome c oxidase assembly protein subunit 15